MRCGKHQENEERRGKRRWTRQLCCPGNCSQGTAGVFYFHVVDDPGCDIRASPSNVCLCANSLPCSMHVAHSLSEIRNKAAGALTFKGGVFRQTICAGAQVARGREHVCRTPGIQSVPYKPLRNANIPYEDDGWKNVPELRGI